MTKMKKLLSLLLALIMTAACFSVTAGAAKCTATSSNLPIIYIKGNASAKLYNKKGERIWPLKKSLNSVIAANKDDIVDAAVKSFTNGRNWNILGDKLEEIIAPLFAELMLDNGKNKSGVTCEPSLCPVDRDGKYDIEEYLFKYDMRLDPLEVAKSLRKYVEDVLEATGKTQVNLVCRCMGAVVMSAYLYKYKTDTKVASAIFYSGGMKGILIEEAPFCGEITLSSETLSQYVSETGEESLSSMFQTLTNIFGSKRVAGTANSLMAEALPVILPRLLRDCYANFPSYWALIGDDHYAAAKNYIFSTSSLKKQYAGLISIIDNYHNKVQLNLDETLLFLKNVKGVNISVITKYNCGFDPIYEGSEDDGDEWIRTSAQSFGATVSEHDKRLPVSYCNALSEAGLGKYVSSDRKIDATTCLFPDSTWFIKNCKHSNWKTFISPLFYAIFSKPTQVTVDTYSNFPQFLKLSSNKLVNIYNYDNGKNLPVEKAVASPEKYEYNGNNKTPTIVVRIQNGEKLTKNVDYKVTYQEERASIGKHYAKVTFIGNYAGTPARKVYFKIYPSDVSELTASSVTTNGATLKWNASKGATEYSIYKRDDAKKVWKKIGSTTSTQFKVTGLTPGTDVKLAVRGVRFVGSAAYRSPDYIKVTVKLKPKAPVITVTPGTKSATVTWAGVTGASSYQIFRSATRGGIYSKVGTTSSTKFVNSGLTTGRTYYFKVRAIRTAGKQNLVGGFSSIASAKIR